MALSTAEQEAVDRLSEYNGSPFNASSNPRGLAGDGYKTNGPQAWNDTATAAEAVARETAAAAAHAASAGLAKDAAVAAQVAQAADNDLTIAAIAALVEEAEAARDAAQEAQGAAGIGEVQAGSASAPGLRFQGDTDTGLFLALANALAVAAGGAVATRFQYGGSSFVIVKGNGDGGNAGVGASSGGFTVSGPAGVVVSTAGGVQALFSDVGNAVNYLLFKGGAAGDGVGLAALGSDPNVDITLNPFGSGLVRIVSGGLKFPDGSTQTTASSGSMTNPMTTAGDLILGGSGGTPTRLGVGEEGAVLTVVSGVPAWAGLASGYLASGYLEHFSALAGVNTGSSTVWTGLSGNAYTLSQTTSGSRPTLSSSGGVTYLDFDGTDDALVSQALSALDPDGSTGFVIQALISTDETSASGKLIYWDETSSWGSVDFAPFQSGVAWRFGTGQTSNMPSTTFTNQSTGWFVLTLRKSGTSEYVYLNRTQVYTASTFLFPIANTQNYFSVGAKTNSSGGSITNPLNGRIAELLIYNTDIGAAAIAQNVGVLGRRHSLIL